MEKNTRSIIQVLRYVGKYPYGTKLRGAGAKSKRKRKKYEKYFIPKKEAKEMVNRIKKGMEQAWDIQKSLLKEHQTDCVKEHCHLCWRGDSKKW